MEEPLLGGKVSRGRSYTQPRRYTARKRSYLRGEPASSRSPTRPIINPFDDDALNHGAASRWNKQERIVPTVQDSAEELPLSTPFANSRSTISKSEAFEVDKHRTAPLF